MPVMKRREFIMMLGGAAVAWPLTARAQQPAALIGFLVSGAPNSFAIFVDAFNQGMLDNGLSKDETICSTYASPRAIITALTQLPPR